MADALSAHERALGFGGRAGIPNRSLVESAIARPYTGYYRKIEQKAAALVESMARNHGFADGNKRTTVILLRLLLSKSGYELLPLESIRNRNAIVEQMVLDVVNNKIPYRGLVAWFRPRIRRSDR